jgi:hypothetical protein
MTTESLANKAQTKTPREIIARRLSLNFPQRY